MASDGCSSELLEQRVAVGLRHYRPGRGRRRERFLLAEHGELVINHAEVEGEHDEVLDEVKEVGPDRVHRLPELLLVGRVVELLAEHGPSLPFPYSSGTATSRHRHMRELRIQHEGRPYRVLYAFDPRRAAILLLGGDKTGNDRWYEEHVPVADNLYDEYLKELEREGLI